MPQYENTSMALLVNYTDHDQESYYGGYEYDARQRSLFMNYIYQSIFGNNPNQKFSAGASFNYDNYDEIFGDYKRTENGLVKNTPVNPQREERVGGVFSSIPYILDQTDIDGRFYVMIITIWPEVL